MMISDLVKEDATGEFYGKGLRLIFGAKLPVRSQDSSEFITAAGEGLDDTVQRFLAYKIIDQMTLEMMAFYPPDQQAAIEKRYRDHMESLERGRSEFRKLDEFLRSIGVKGTARILNMYQNAQIPQSFLKARTKNPELPYAI
jgi:hypothetical protein